MGGAAGCDRTWAIESADGLGKLLAQQLLGAGEDVVDVLHAVGPGAAAGSTKAAKNDGNDALATAIAGLRHCGLRAVRVEDHPRCCGCWWTATTTSSGCAPRRPVGCMSPYASSSLVALHAAVR